MQSSLSINHIRAAVAAASLLAPVANMAAYPQTPARDEARRLRTYTPS